MSAPLSPPVSRQDTRFLPPEVTGFLAQLADVPGTADCSAASYAASVILPRTRWPVEEFLPRLLADLSAPHNRLVLERALHKQRKSLFAPFTLTLTDNEGGNVDFLVLSRPARLSGGRHIVTAALAAPGASPDSQAGSQPDIRAERARLLNLLEALPAYVVLIDQNHSIQFDNQVFRQLYGPGRDKPCYQALKGLSEPCANCPPFSVLSSRNICVSEWACGRTNNVFRVHSYPFEEPGGNKMVLKVGINITAGIRARHALDISEQLYRNIADNLTIGVAMLDPQLAVVTLNPRLVEWFGLAADRGAPICDILHRQCADAEQGCESCVFRNTFAHKRTHEQEFSLLTHNGETRRFRMVACPLLTRKHDVRAVIMMLEDITERHNLALRSQHLRRLEAMSSLAGGIAHEINQPLSALHLYASGLQLLMEKQADLPLTRIMERLSLILSQADKIRDIISHMRALVMQEEIPIGAVSVRGAAEGALALVGAQLDAHTVSVTLDIPETMPLVRATRVQMEQVFINLLSNAMHALDSLESADSLDSADSPDAEDSLRKTVHISARQAADSVLLQVRDNGPGVQGMEEQVFIPFFTTKEAHQGMGLGLSIVHAFINAWGGEITARNNGASPGATFTLKLRAADAGEQEDLG